MPNLFSYQRHSELFMILPVTVNIRCIAATVEPLTIQRTFRISSQFSIRGYPVKLSFSKKNRSFFTIKSETQDTTHIFIYPKLDFLVLAFHWISLKLLINEGGACWPHCFSLRSTTHDRDMTP